MRMNKTILITGANRGIGLEFVRQYAATNEFTVYAACRSPEKATDLLQLQQQYSNQIQTLPLDVTDQKQIDNLALSVNSVGLDILINNAGVYGPYKAGLGQLDTQAWLNTFAVNSIAPIKIIEALIPSLQQGTEKKLITITSKMGSISDNQSGSSYLYRSSKAAVNMAMKSVAIDTEAYNFICAVLHPGWVKTDMGGANAEISVEESVSSMKRIIDKLSAEDTGSFIDLDGSKIL